MNAEDADKNLLFFIRVFSARPRPKKSGNQTLIGRG
jgi:hypothetical protein